jgi:hypothetical protein
MRIRTALATSAALVALAACGGNRDASPPPIAPPPPRAPRPTAPATAWGAAATGDTGAMAPGAAAGTNASLATRAPRPSWTA